MKLQKLLTAVGLASALTIAPISGVPELQRKTLAQTHPVGRRSLLGEPPEIGKTSLPPGLSEGRIDMRCGYFSKDPNESERRGRLLAEWGDTYQASYELELAYCGFKAQKKYERAEQVDLMLEKLR